MSVVAGGLDQGRREDPPLRVDVPLAGVTVTPMTAAEVAAYVERLVETGGGGWIANHNLHSLYVYHTDEQFRASYLNAGRVLIDGWPVLALARRARNGQDLTSEHRIGSSDWLFHLLTHSTRPLQIVAVGGTPNSSSLAAGFVSREYPKHTWMAFDGYRFARRDRVDSLKSLRSALTDADLVIVGMGMPNQERWISENWPLLEGSVVANVGGCIDYIAGTQKLAPRWMGRAGCEWLFRLVRSPRRLFYRYVIETQLLAAILVKRAVLRRFGRANG